MDLKIGENILKQRQKTGLTQEALAAALKVSPQAISNWERGGYPDITMLPIIANYFRITVDELIGFDEASREADIQAFLDSIKKLPHRETLEPAKAYYAKYPSDFRICEALAFAIMANRSCWERDYPLLKEACSNIMANCTWEYTRQNALECMSIVCPDEEWKEWEYKNKQFYSSCLNERIEERHWRRKRDHLYADYSIANDLLIMMHFLGREHMRYYEKGNDMLFADPVHTASLMTFRMKMIESISESGEIPEAWSGCYADCSLKLAGAMIASGEIDRGFAELERCFSLYEAWLKIPDGKKMETGSRALFGSARISKCASDCVVNIFFDDGETVWVPYLWLFWQNKRDIKRAMQNWCWFDPVREDSRYLTAYRRAVEMAGKHI